MKLHDLTSFLDRELRTAEIQDASQNGLQVEGNKDITAAAFAVDASLSSIQKAADCGAQILIVHHGIFWDRPVRATGMMYRRLKALMENGCALYASHLPLDLHPVLGNNAQIANALGMTEIVPFGNYHGVTIGFGGNLPAAVSAEELSSSLSRLSGAPCRAYSHREKSLRVAVVSGGGAALLDEAAAAGYDTFITGESSHQSFHPAAEYGMNMLFGGHYATETFGVKALKGLCEEKFALKTVFIDLPTGM
ncbi:MAG: Nif3-like dinuclear metal center hexameric protein [Spirochaetota bacterium]